MLDILSRERLALCDRVSRRTAMSVGALGTLGVGLPQVLRAAHADTARQTAHAGSGFGRAKRVILLFMWGGPAHQDTWDLKPDGPPENRGEFRPIATNVPGIEICEHFPLIARQADKLALIRSVGQEDNNHSTGAHAGLTGRRHETRAENFAARDTDFPHYGSVLTALRPNTGGLPTFVSLPDIIATTAGVVTPGQFGGMLGHKYDPFTITDHPDELDFSISTLKLPGGLDVDRMRRRRTLLSRVDEAARLVERSAAAKSLDAFYERALDMVLSPEARRAFDMDAVPEEERWRYGWHTFGQSVLLARRLIEAGVRLVTVYWHREVKTIDSSWDTHSVNFTELKNRLMPSVDRPIAALLEDLQARGLLDETLVVWNSEFGRTPRINANAGRDHWGPCNTVVMAGGGVPGGQVFGASDERAAYPTRDKVTQDDIAATMYHLLGIPPETPVYDKTGRPHHVALGEPIWKLLRPAGSDPLQRVAGVQAVPRPAEAGHYERYKRDLGPFYHMLIERGRRFLCCALGRADGERDWKLTGWSEPVGDGRERHRVVGLEPATIRYEGHFYGHFNYGFIVLRLAEPRSLSDSTLTLGDRVLPVPEELSAAPPARLWQVPLAEGLIPATRTFELKVEAGGWPVTDIALVGDRILEHHLEHFGV
ncbi:MAG: DUF1501 domain-containing protein [Planctomycetes bacterium]|nr:DUF1501 domain-containing protein [Planctomycetota bacterium]